MCAGSHFLALLPISSKYTDRGSEQVVQDRLGHFRAVLGIPDLRASVRSSARKKSKSALASRVGIGWRSLSSISGATFQDTPVAGEGASQSFERVGTAATQGDWSLGEGHVGEGHVGEGHAHVSAPRAETAHAVALPMLNTAVRATGGLHRQQMRLSATAGARFGINAGIEARPGAHTALGLVSPSPLGLVSPSPAVRPGVFEKSQRLLARLGNS
jgi:hypothetical protein